MGNPTQNRPLLVDSFDEDYSEMLETLFRTLTPYFDEINSLTNNRLTFDQNSLCSIRELTGVTLNKINSGGVIITTDIENPVDIVITLQKADGTLVTAADIEWKNLGSGRIQITKLNTLQTTGSVDVDISDVFANHEAIAKNTGDILALARLINQIKSELTTDEEAQLLNTNYRIEAEPKTDHITVTTDVNLTDMDIDISSILTSYNKDIVQSGKITTFTLSKDGVETDIVIDTTVDEQLNSDWNISDPSNIRSIDNQPVSVTTGVTQDGTDLLIGFNQHGVTGNTRVSVGEINPTAAEIKTLYESNADTNAFTDVFKGLVEQVENGFLQSISFDSISNQVTITDNSGIVTEFGALPAPTLPNAGRILQQSADGTTWNLVSLAAATQSARELPCFAYAGAINNFLTRRLYAVSNVLPMSAWDPATFSFVEANLTATDSIVPCMTWNPTTQTYADNNIPLE